MPYGKNGITCDDASLLDTPDLTIRHVDLKAWMIRFYPEQRPAFLFDAFERHLHPAISMDAVQALLMDREALKLQLADRLKAWDVLHQEFQALSGARAAEKKPEGELGPRSESTYLNIVGGLLTLLLGKSPSGIPYRPTKSGSMTSAAMAFMRDHGVLKDIYSESTGTAHKTAKGSKISVRTVKAPGFWS